MHAQNYTSLHLSYMGVYMYNTHSNKEDSEDSDVTTHIASNDKI